MEKNAVDEYAVDATEEHDEDDAQPELETLINIVSNYLQISCLALCIQENANKP